MAIADLGTSVAGTSNTGATAALADDRIIMNTETGALSFNADGTGPAAAIPFPVLSANTGLATAANSAIAQEGTSQCLVARVLLRNRTRAALNLIVY